MPLSDDQLRFCKRILVDENPNPDEVRSYAGRMYTARRVYGELERGDTDLCEYMRRNFIDNPEMRKQFPEAKFPEVSPQQ